MSVEAFNQAVDALNQRMGNPRPMTFDDLRDVAGAVVQAGEIVDFETRTAGIGRMVDTILAAASMRSAMTAIACGALVEQGANPYTAVHAIITRLGDILGHAAQFAQACRDQADAEGVPIDQAIDRFGEGLSLRMNAEATAYSAMEIMSRPTVAMISRSKRARRAANDEGRMASRARRFPIHHDMLHWLNQLLAVLDDETLIVIHPEYQRGYRVEIEGIAGNHQLFVLLEDALVGDESAGWLPGEKPRPQAVAAATQYSQYGGTPHAFAFHYTSGNALNAAGLIDLTDKASWLLGEGIPADIPKFDGQRVLLLGATVYTQTFRIASIYEGLEPDLRVIEQLDAKAIEAWLDRLKTDKND